jgi:hypothetical protein
MMSFHTVTVDGYEFEITAYYEASLQLGSDAPLVDKAYFKALRKAQKLLPYFTALHLFNVTGEQGGMENVLLVIEAYEKKLIAIPEYLYQQAINIRDRIYVPRVTVVKTRKPPKPGYVYLIKSPSGHYKIGRAIDPHDRVRTFGVQLPFEVEIIALIQTDDYVRLEKSLHAYFESQRVNGEWFNLSPADVEYIKSLSGVTA